MRDNDSTDNSESENNAPQTIRHIRQWPVEVKRRIVEETFVPGASVSIVARRRDINTNLLFNWRRKYRQGELVDNKSAANAGLPGHDFVRIGVIEPDGGLRPLSVSGEPSVTSPSQSRSTHCDGATVRQEGSAGLESGKSGIIEIELPNRIKVRAGAGIDEPTLRRLLSVAKDLAC